jgi:hypothetical protein
MTQRFDPPRYTWNAATVSEVKAALEAAGELIDAHLRTLEPGDGVARMRAARTAPAAMTLSLDLSGLVQAVNDQHTLRGLESGLPDICDCGREKQPGEDHGMCYPGMEWP